MTSRICLVMALLLGGMPGARAADLPAWDFEQGVQGWLSLDQQAELVQEKDGGHVHEGAASLRFSFGARAAAAGELPGVMGVPVPGVTGARCLHLAVQTSVAGPVVLALRETDESNYLLFAYLTADEWHALDFPLAEFRLDEHSQDENGRLDPEQVNFIGVADPGVFLAQANLPFFYARPNQRTLWVDEVELLEGEPDRLAAAAAAGTVMLEDCDSDTGYFMVFGGRDLRATACDDPAVRGKSLRLDYTLPRGTLLAALRQVAAGALAGARGITFSVRSGAALPLLLLLEEDDRSRYQKVIELAPGRWQTPVITWADMTLSEDTKDPDEGIQPETVRSLGFVDASAALGQKETANTLWLDEITTAP